MCLRKIKFIMIYFEFSIAYTTHHKKERVAHPTHLIPEHKLLLMFSYTQTKMSTSTLHEFMESRGIKPEVIQRMMTEKVGILI